MASLFGRMVNRAMQPVRHLGLRRLQGRIFREMEAARRSPQPSFPKELRLPKDFAKSMPERAVELLLATQTYKPGARVLDVGHANAQKCHLLMLKTLAEPRRLTGIDIAPPTYDVGEYYERTISGDITRIPEADGSFDVVWCISTIEHVGLDNSAYTTDFTLEGNADMRAARELLRVVAPGGTLLLTVPYGRSENLGWSRNYDRARWQAMLDNFRPSADVHELYFRHTYGRGWEPAPPEELAYVGYYDQANYGAGAMAAVVVTRRTVPAG